MKREKKFKLRPFVSLFTALSFIHLIITSVVLYIVPPGRFANYANWKLLGITKGGWEAQHIIMGFLFVGFAVIHLILNWKVFKNYIRSKVKKAVNRTWELIAAVVLVVFISLGTVYNLAPFSSVMNLGDNLSNSWEKKALSTGESSSTSNNSSSQTNSAQTAENGTDTEQESATGQGMGRKDLKTVIEENSVDLQTAINRLKKHGLDVSPDDIMKDISTKYDIGFSDIIDIFTKE